MANRFLVSGGNGNWSSTTNWASVSGGSSGATAPVAGDVVAFDSLSGNANITVDVASACASLVMSGTYAGTLTFTSTLTLTSTCTFNSTCTIAGTTGTLILSTGNVTYTSAGKTLTCGLTLTTNAGYTFADNWTVNGLVTFTPGAGPALNGASSKLICAAGLTQTGTSASVGGTATLELTGGTWTPNGSIYTSNVNLNGNITILGTLAFSGGKTFKYVSGTITTTGSTFNLSGNCTVDTAGVTWNNVTISGAVVVTLNSALTWTGTLLISAGGTVSGTGALSGTGPVSLGGGVTVTFNNPGGLVTTGTMTLPNNTLTFAGSAGFTVGTLTTIALSSSRTYTLTVGNTYRVTAGLNNNGGTTSLRMLLKSSSAGNRVAFVVDPACVQTLVNCDPTDIDSSGGATVYSAKGTLTNTVNWLGAVTASPSMNYFRGVGVM